MMRVIMTVNGILNCSELHKIAVEIKGQRPIGGIFRLLEQQKKLYKTSLT